MEETGKRWGAEDLLQMFPLHRACRDGDLRALSKLLGDSVVSVCDAAAQDPLFGWTPAHWAAHNGKVDCLQMLASAGVPCNRTTCRSGLTLAHSAALEGQATCLAWLCQNGVCIDAQDHMGETAAHKAVRCGSLQCLDVLRKHGANFSLQNNSGFTARDLAIQNQQQHCVDYFIAGGDMASHPFQGGNGVSAVTDTGNRKRAQDSEEGADSSKRARIENGYASIHPEPHIAHSNGIRNSPATATTTFNGMAARPAPAPETDPEIPLAYASSDPCSQPYLTTKPLRHPSTKGHNDHSSDELTADEDMMNVDDVSLAGDSRPLRKRKLDSEDTYPVVARYASSFCNGSTSSMVSVQKDVDTISCAMSNGALEHHEMVQHSMGYESTLFDAMYDFDATPCGHAY